jgi:RNA polymerase sigma-70 factor (ECF subfamily)
MATYRELTENYIATRSHEDYTALYRKVKPGLQNYVKNIIKDSDIAEDIAVNTLIKMWTKIDQYDPQYQITTWLYRIAYNESLYYIRERNRKTSIDRLRDEYGVEVTSMNNVRALEELIDDAAYKSEMDWYEEESELNDTYENALKAIRELKPLYKDILVDRLIGNMKYEDIAKKHDLPLQTIKNRIRRGRTLIVEAIGVEVNF